MRCGNVCNSQVLELPLQQDTTVNTRPLFTAHYVIGPPSPKLEVANAHQRHGNAVKASRQRHKRQVEAAFSRPNSPVSRQTCQINVIVGLSKYQQHQCSTTLRTGDTRHRHEYNTLQ